MNEDIRSALGSAFAEEPKLGIDREQVIRKGHNRLVRRRFALSTGMAVGVTGLVIGAAVLTGAQTASSGPGEVPPAQQLSCQELHPRTTDYSSSRPTTGTGGPPGSNSRAPVTTTAPPPCTAENASALTAVLAATNPVPAGFTAQVVPEAPGLPLQFFRRNNEFRAVADLVDEQGTAALYVSVDARPVDLPPMTCEGALPGQCEERVVGDLKVLLVTEQEDDGTIRYRAISQRPNGIAVTVNSHNKARYQENSPGKPASSGTPTRPAPALDLERIAMIATQPGLTF